MHKNKIKIKYAWFKYLFLDSTGIMQKIKGVHDPQAQSGRMVAAKSLILLHFVETTWVLYV